jgi:hypothetical protein
VALYHNRFPFFGTSLLVWPNFISTEPMSTKRKEYQVDARAKKAALFFLACEPNPVTRISIPAGMRAKVYSDLEAADWILVQQVRRKSQKNKSNDTPRPESAAVSSLLALVTAATAASSRLALRTTPHSPDERGWRWRQRNKRPTRATGGQWWHQHGVVDEAIVTRATTPAVLSGREDDGGRRLAGMVLPGQEGSSVWL